MTSTTAASVKYLHVRDAAEVIGVKNEAVYELIRRGQLRAHRPGRKWLIHPDDLHACITASRPADAETSPWLAATLAKFTPDDIRRTAEVLLAVADAGPAAGGGTA
jgi:excisionase family DNA binding protein